MRVLQLIPSVASRTGGPAVAVVEASLALGKLGIESTIYATDMARAACARRHCRVSDVDLPVGARVADLRIFRARPPYRLAFSPDLYRALAREVVAYDVVHIHSLYLFPQFAGFHWAARHSVPYLVSPHGALDPFLRTRGRTRKAVAEMLWQRRMLETAAALHVTTEVEATLIADIASHVPRVVVPNGIHWADYQNLPPEDDFRERHLGGHPGPLVMFLGRVTFKKGLDILIRAFAAVARAVPDCQLAIVGPDDERLTPELEALAVEAGVRDRVVFTGMLGGKEKLAALAAADAWALPSHTENFGVAVVEALAAGRAVVVSPAVNIARELAAASAGFVCEQSPEPLARELVRVLLDQGERAAVGARAREFARRYDWALVGRDLAAMYSQVAEEGKRVSAHSLSARPEVAEW
jgi:glycosyltransferase involved in cell wall biosynthesis